MTMDDVGSVLFIIGVVLIVGSLIILAIKSRF